MIGWGIKINLLLRGHKMKTAIMSDFHSVSPIECVKRLHGDGIERFAFLGDYDEPSVLRDILDLDVDKIVLVGNHDYEFVRGKEVFSPKLKSRPSDYIEKWADCPEGKFIENSSTIYRGRKRGMKVIDRSKRPTVYVHGCLVNGVAWEVRIPEIWGRLNNPRVPEITDEQRRFYNLREMKKKNYDIMFRGHDHFNGIVSALKKNDFRHSGGIDFSQFGMDLEKNKRYIVSVGAFCEGKYAIYDDVAGNVRFIARMSGR